MSAELQADEFPSFFAAVHGYEPFPWQTALAHKVFTGGWPRAIDVPTAGGKTACIDIGVFHLALEADRGSERRAPVRVLFVVDRRLIVDDAYARAQKIAAKLAQEEDTILARVAKRLRVLAEHKGRPLATARLRGGIPQDPDWVRTPAQPTILVSTVDQVGSRLLFRGYGVSEGMRPVHAGLLGADALILLDEAHLSQPFLQTVRDSRLFEQPDQAPVPFDVVTLSATQTDDEAFRLGEEDYAHPELGRRLRAAKPTELIEVDSASDGPLYVEACAEEAWSLSVVSEGAAVIVAVVVNRVARARAIFDALQRRGAVPLTDGADGSTTDAPADLALLIGRTRELDREAVLAHLLPRMRAGRAESSVERPLFVVATQCIEAGADLDFDALVMEVAPLDCLRQRVGRLNRMGRPIVAKAVILAGTDQVSPGASDPIYGQAPMATWALLRSLAKGKRATERRTIDMGVAASNKWLPRDDEIISCLTPRKEAPLLLHRHVELLTQTSPTPAVDPDIPLLLHGPAAGPADVQIVWRADLDDVNEDAWADLIGVCPPSALEAVAVPIGEARRWLLNGTATGDVADVEAAPAVRDESRARFAGTQALRWRGTDDDDTLPISSGQVAPGDVLVVPSERGGCDRWGWAPRSTSTVGDRGREANRVARGREILRFTRATPELVKNAAEERRLAEELEDLSDADVIRTVLDRFEIGRGARVLRSQRGGVLAVEWHAARGAVGEQPVSAWGRDAASEDDGSIHTVHRAVTLSEHSAGVERHARRFAAQAGLSEPFGDDVALAGLLHDSGKAHPTFKRFLYGGDELASAGGPDLAKSAKTPRGAALRNARRRATLPDRARHEVASLAFAEVHPRLAAAHDPELVLWLIGTHHGHGRPFFPPVEWPTPGDTFTTDVGDGRIAAGEARSLDGLVADWVELFARLRRRYGAWGLARLEAILRLSDHRQSELEQTPGSMPGESVSSAEVA